MKETDIEAMQWPGDDETDYDSVCQRAGIHRWVNSSELGWQTLVVPAENPEDIHAALVTPTGERIRILPNHWVIRRPSGEFFVQSVLHPAGASVMSEQLDLSTLPQRMRAAAEVLSEAAARLKPDDAPGWYLSTWSSDSLTRVADRWEAEDLATRDRDAQIEALAGILVPMFLSWTGDLCEPMCREAARIIIETGWRRG